MPVSTKQNVHTCVHFPTFGQREPTLEDWNQGQACHYNMVRVQGEITRSAHSQQVRWRSVKAERPLPSIMWYLHVTKKFWPDPPQADPTHTHRPPSGLTPHHSQGARGGWGFQSKNRHVRDSKRPSRLRRARPKIAFHGCFSLNNPKTFSCVSFLFSLGSLCLPHPLVMRQEWKTLTFYKLPSVDGFPSEPLLSIQRTLQFLSERKLKQINYFHAMFHNWWKCVEISPKKHVLNISTMISHSESHAASLSTMYSRNNATQLAGGFLTKRLWTSLLNQCWLMFPDQLWFLHLKHWTSSRQVPMRNLCRPMPDFSVYKTYHERFTRKLNADLLGGCFLGVSVVVGQAFTGAWWLGKGASQSRPAPAFLLLKPWTRCDGFEEKTVLLGISQNDNETMTRTLHFQLRCITRPSGRCQFSWLFKPSQDWCSGLRTKRTCQQRGLKLPHTLL